MRVRVCVWVHLGHLTSSFLWLCPIPACCISPQCVHLCVTCGRSNVGSLRKVIYVNALLSAATQRGTSSALALVALQMIYISSDIYTQRIRNLWHIYNKNKNTYLYCINQNDDAISWAQAKKERKKERKEGTKLALCIGNAIRQSVVKLKTRLDAMPHKRRAHSGTCGTWYSVHGTWYLSALAVCTGVEAVDSKLDKSKTTQYKSHNMANS